jgi:hypothetical protein
MRILASLLLLFAARFAVAQQYDVIVYGVTPAGIAAAVAAASDGEKVLLVSPEARIGGMVTNGLSHTDFRTFEGLTGAYYEHSQRVIDYYRPQFGAQASQVSFAGTHAEPKANLAVFEKAIAGQPGITVQRRWALEGLKCSVEADGDAPGRVRTAEIALFVDETGEKHPVPARYFIDATYEGDLFAAAGVPYRVGREGRDAFGESLAPAEGDNQLQGYNFRLMMTDLPANRVPVQAPPGYQREDFEGLVPVLESGKLNAIFGMRTTQIYKAQTPPLPNGKYDINDMSHGPIRLSMPGLNDNWPDGGGGVAIRGGATDAIDTPPFSRTGLAMARAQILRTHLQWNVGLLYFLQNDPAVPAKFRDEAREWGWCKDELVETNHLPEQIYVREARRMIGQYIYSERDSEFAEGDARAVLFRDSIAMGDYGPNCHGTGRDGTLFDGKHTGEFYKPVAPYQVPYGVMVPTEVDNLLVACAVSSTHVGFCTLRFEPIWMSLGQAAGHAVHIARKEKVPVQRVPVGKLQRRLHQAGAASIYVSDVMPGSADFAAVQWWGTAGGFHGLAPTPDRKDIRGAHLFGQYFYAFPNHAADLDVPLTPELSKRWTTLATELGLDARSLPGGERTTRGDFIRAAWQLAKPPVGAGDKTLVQR